MELLSRDLRVGICLALVFIAGPTPAAAQEPLGRPGSTNERLHSITVSLAFSKVSLADATRFLSEESKQLDPGHRGINFIFMPGAADSAKSITLTLDKVPMAVALGYICQLANVKYKVQDYGVTILPFNAGTDDLVTRTFSVPPNFVEPPSSSQPASP